MSNCVSTTPEEWVDAIYTVVVRSALKGSSGALFEYCADTTTAQMETILMKMFIVSDAVEDSTWPEAVKKAVQDQIRTSFLNMFEKAPPEAKKQVAAQMECRFSQYQYVKQQFGSGNSFQAAGLLADMFKEIVSPDIGPLELRTSLFSDFTNCLIHFGSGVSETISEVIITIPVVETPRRQVPERLKSVAGEPVKSLQSTPTVQNQELTSAIDYQLSVARVLAENAGKTLTEVDLQHLRSENVYNSLNEIGEYDEQLYATLLQGFVHLGKKGETCVPINFQKAMGKALAEQYPEASDAFLRFAATYWPFKLWLDGQVEDKAMGSSLKGKPMVLALLRVVETNIAGRFFPTPGGLKVPPDKREELQRALLKQLDPTFPIEEFIKGNPILIRDRAKGYGHERQRSALDQLEHVIVGGYRMIAARQGCAPTSQTTDQEIIDIYKKVGTAFRQASEQGGEHLPAGTMNFIVWKFIQVKEQFGNDMLDAHLKYEVEKYQTSGLRPDYRHELNLFPDAAPSKNKGNPTGPMVLGAFWCVAGLLAFGWEDIRPLACIGVIGSVVGIVASIVGLLRNKTRDRWYAALVLSLLGFVSCILGPALSSTQ